ncbi:MAG: NAD-dependent epimerase/dehydratase family protein [Curvibacter sp.]|nr:MAG: NAD-dependent epimerase/dehydratase family protein [Curvibacter sp.]
MQQRVLVLGARGRFGLAAVRAFADAGWQVVGHMRPGAKVPTEVANDGRVEWVACDLYDTAAVAKAAGTADVVVHALNPHYTHKAWRAEALPMTEAALAVTRALGATLMFMGNVYNFGKDMPDVLREDTPQRAHTVKGQVRMAMEALIARSGVRAVVIRAGDFFGSGHGSWFDQAIVKNIRKGVLTYPGQHHIATAWAYLPDLARTFVLVAQKRTELRPFEVLHFAGYQLTAQQWVDAITPVAQLQGWVQPQTEVKLSRLPWPVIKLGALLVPTWAALLEMRYLWDRAHSLANDRLVTLIGPEPHTPLPAAVAQSLADLHLLPATTSAEARTLAV